MKSADENQYGFLYVGNKDFVAKGIELPINNEEIFSNLLVKYDVFLVPTALRVILGLGCGLLIPGMIFMGLITLQRLMLQGQQFFSIVADLLTVIGCFFALLYLLGLQPARKPRRFSGSG